MKKINMRVVIVCLVVTFMLGIVIYMVRSSTFANYNPFAKETLFGTLRLDEDAYGNTVFDASSLKLKTILDKDSESSFGSVIYIPFYVGGSKDNDVDDAIYDIALQDLNVDCNLLSPYVKWKLKKNGKVISQGSLDYHFDTIKKGRLVLTNTQQDLIPYNEDKNKYDYFEFYLWLSDSCQEEDISLCTDNVYQNNLLNKKFSGKIEVELYGGEKKELDRNPSDELDISTCISSQNL